MMTKFHTAQDAIQIIKDKGFNPDTVVDVGVATGTPWLYNAFPRAFYHLFEPIDDFHDTIKIHLTKLNGKLYPMALGDQNLNSIISVADKSRKGGGSLVFKPTEGGFQQETIVRRLDTILSVADLGNHNLLKTDCQGYDFAVLLGAGALLSYFEIVIVETPLKSRLFNFSDIVSHMRKNEFEVIDIVDPIYRPSDKLLGQVDLIFALKI